MIWSGYLELAVLVEKELGLNIDKSSQLLLYRISKSQVNFYSRNRSYSNNSILYSKTFRRWSNEYDKFWKWFMTSSSIHKIKRNGSKYYLPSRKFHNNLIHVYFLHKSSITEVILLQIGCPPWWKERRWLGEGDILIWKVRTHLRPYLKTRLGGVIIHSQSVRESLVN